MIYNLQLLRVFAALSVVYLHTVSDAGLNLRAGVGNYGVDVFFVISGFMMSHLVRKPAGDFLLRRLIRIVPLYWTATLGTFGVALIAPTMLQSASSSVPMLIHSLLFVPYPNKFGLLQPTLALGWTLNYEAYFYVLVTLAAIISPRLAPMVSAVLLVAIAALISLSGTNAAEVRFYADPIVVEFVYGIVAYYIVAAIGSESGVSRRMGFLRMLTVFLAAASALALPAQEWFLSGERALLAGAPAFGLVLCAVVLERRFGLAARYRGVVLLGNSSYLLYLVHPWVIYGVIRLLVHAESLRGPVIVALIAMLPVFASATAIVMHVYIETPILKILHRAWVPMTPTAATSTASR